MDSRHRAAIVLAGGQSRRMGYRDKAQISVNGRRLIDQVWENLHTHWPTAYTVAVSPHEICWGGHTTTETPPGGGPVAGIAAGLEAVDSQLPNCEVVAILAVDAPGSPLLLPALEQQLAGDSAADVCVVEAADGHLQPLCAVWRRASLAAALQGLGETRDVAAKTLLRQAGTWLTVRGDGREQDYDSLAQLKALGVVDTTTAPLLKDMGQQRQENF